jgi:hypothetical protein
MGQINGLSGVVSGATANTFQLGINTSGFSPYISGGIATRTDNVYEVASPYLAADLFELKFVQSLDTLYILHNDYAPRKLTRTDHSNWTLTTITFLDGPYLPTNTGPITLNPSANSGNITIAASAPLWAATDVGRLVRILYASNWGYARITGFTSTTVVSATVINNFQANTPNANWRLGLWSDTTGYPSCGTFHQDRLCLAGSRASLQRIDMSASGDYENFLPSATDGTVIASHAVSVAINTDDVNVIRWIKSDEKGLIVTTMTGEFVVSANSPVDPITPTDVVAKTQGAFGSADISPVRVGRANLYVQRSEQKIREILFDFYTDGFRSTDLSLLSEHVTRPGVKELAFQKEKQPILWCVLDDGSLAALTYERDIQELRAAWSRHQLGGFSDAGGSPARVETVAVVPSSFGAYDEVWFVVLREVAGLGTVRHIEFLSDIWDRTFERDTAFFVDCGVQRFGFVITGITNANPAVVTTSADHGYSNGDTVVIHGVAGMTEVNHKVFTVAGVTSNSFQLSGVNSFSFGKFRSGSGRPEVARQQPTLSGLSHLEGETVDVFYDGGYQTAVVTGGAVTPTHPMAFASIGYHYESDLQLLRFDVGSAEGTAQGKIRRTHRASFLFEQTLGVLFGFELNSSRMDRMLFEAPFTGITGVNLFSGVKTETMQAKYDLNDQIALRIDQPFPATILSINPRSEVQDGG